MCVAQTRSRPPAQQEKLTLAKATTGKDRGLAARSRAARTSPTDDEALREEESDPAGEQMMNEEPEFDGEEDEAVEEPDNALPAAFASEQSLTSTADRTARR